MLEKRYWNADTLSKKVAVVYDVITVILILRDSRQRPESVVETAPGRASNSLETCAVIFFLGGGFERHMLYVLGDVPPPKVCDGNLGLSFTCCYALLCGVDDTQTMFRKKIEMTLIPIFITFHSSHVVIRTSKHL